MGIRSKKGMKLDEGFHILKLKEEKGMKKYIVDNLILLLKRCLFGGAV